MQYFGEMISLGVACLWTVSALSAEVATRRLGIFVMNVWRMALAFVLSVGLMLVFTGTMGLDYASAETWLWLLASGVVGYFFGDWCLFNSYLTIGSRYGQLLMTLAPMFTALSAWVLIGQTLSWSALLAMSVTMAGIAISLLQPLQKEGCPDEQPGRFSPPFGGAGGGKGILFGIGAALGQGLGLVLSKIGLDHYVASMPADLLPAVENFLPFSANSVRCIAGFVCFTSWYLIRRKSYRADHHTFTDSFQNRRGLVALLFTVLSGPFLGVGFSLMAVQHTAAGIASTLMATTPILILWPSYYLFGQRITWRNVLGAVISVAGMSLFFLL